VERGQSINVSYAKYSIVFACVHFNSDFTGAPGLAGTRVSPFWILLELRMVEVVVTTGAVRRSKFQSNCHRQQTNHPAFFTDRMPILSPNQQRQSTEGKS